MVKITAVKNAGNFSTCLRYKLIRPHHNKLSLDNVNGFIIGNTKGILISTLCVLLCKFNPQTNSSLYRLLLLLDPLFDLLLLL